MIFHFFLYQIKNENYFLYIKNKTIFTVMNYIIDDYYPKDLHSIKQKYNFDCSKNGLYTTYHKNGSVKKRDCYDNCVLLYSEHYDTEGNKKSFYKYDNYFLSYKIIYEYDNSKYNLRVDYLPSGKTKSCSFYIGEKIYAENNFCGDFVVSMYDSNGCIKFKYLSQYLDEWEYFGVDFTSIYNFYGYFDSFGEENVLQYYKNGYYKIKYPEISNENIIQDYKTTPIKFYKNKLSIFF